MESVPKLSVFCIVTAGNHRGLGFRTPCRIQDTPAAVREEWSSISVIRQTSGAHGTSLSLLSGRGTPTHSEDVVYREVTADHQLFSRRLLTKTNRLPRWAERFFPSGMSRSVYIIEDSIVDPVNRTLTTYTWNLNHTTIMSVEERCVFQDSAEEPATTLLKREAWISSSIYGFSRPIQEFGLARFKSNQVKAMKGLEYALSNLQGEATPWLLRDSVKDTSGKAKEAAKNLASTAASPQKPQQYI